ncbi:MAG TPA: hypothetical protein VKT82_14370 [Ktedonobacterales bacterium]|nr:hypothetical protein [Ktedonobacterales bacterium]
MDDDEIISPDIEEAVAALPGLDDATLWHVADTSHFSPEESEESEELHFKIGRGEQLTDAEKQRQAELGRWFDKVLLVRAHALLLLKQRGYDITPLLKVQRRRR